MASFYANGPAGSSGGSGSNASVGPNGSAAPTSSTEVGFIDDSTGFLAPFSGPTAASGPNVVVTSSALPSGGATAANQVSQEATLSAIEANQTNGTQVVQGPGSAGTPSGGVLTIQGSSSGTPVNVQISGSAAEVGVNLNEVGGSAVAVGTGASNAGTQRVAVSTDSGIATEVTLSAFSSKSASAFINSPFDETVLTYVGSTTQIATVVYKLAGVTINTLTLSYDGSNRLIDVVKT